MENRIKISKEEIENMGREWPINLVANLDDGDSKGFSSFGQMDRNLVAPSNLLYRIFVAPYRGNVGGGR
ncbi:hypothetical protein J4229_01265 [Candidatus Pacearchaeota archaeon]|nr:hypothetical protein [Candidatus Pacearchaeota archaeon]